MLEHAWARWDHSPRQAAEEASGWLAGRSAAGRDGSWQLLQRQSCPPDVRSTTGRTGGRAVSRTRTRAMLDGASALGIGRAGAERPLGALSPSRNRRPPLAGRPAEARSSTSGRRQPVGLPALASFHSLDRRARSRVAVVEVVAAGVEGPPGPVPTRTRVWEDRPPEAIGRDAAAGYCGTGRALLHRRRATLNSSAAASTPTTARDHQPRGCSTIWRPLGCTTSGEWRRRGAHLLQSQATRATPLDHVLRHCASRPTGCCDRLKTALSRVSSTVPKRAGYASYDGASLGSEGRMTADGRGTGHR